MWRKSAIEVQHAEMLAAARAIGNELTTEQEPPLSKRAQRQRFAAETMIALQLAAGVLRGLAERAAVEHDRLRAEYPDGDLWPWLRGLTSDQADGLRALAEGNPEAFVRLWNGAGGRDVIERIMCGLPQVGDGLHTIVSKQGDPLETVEDIPEAGHLWFSAARRVHEIHADRASGVAPRADASRGHSLDRLRPQELLLAAMATLAPADHGQARGVENVRKRAGRMAEKRQADETIGG